MQQMKAVGAAEVVIVHVIDDRRLIQPSYVDTVMGQLQKQSKASMAALAKELEDAGLKV